MSVLLEFSMFPTDKGESVSEYVSQVIKVIRESGVSYQLTPMGTIGEADDLQQVLDLVQAAYNTLEQAGSNRVYSSLKLDIRKGKDNRLQGKLQSIQDKIGDVNV
ncbi:MAG: MTH1187 family thiamine-binding protein [Alphaproteobacteria bacterium]